MHYHLIATKQGQTILGCSSNGVMAYGLVAGDAVDTIQQIDATPEEYADLLTKVPTHDFVYDKQTRKATSKLKKAKTQTPAGAAPTEQAPESTASTVVPLA